MLRSTFTFNVPIRAPISYCCGNITSQGFLSMFDAFIFSLFMLTTLTCWEAS